VLGPGAAFLVLTSVLAVQALFFADGGLLALGGNALNTGAASCFIAYPLIFRPLAFAALLVLARAADVSAWIGPGLFGGPP